MEGNGWNKMDSFIWECNVMDIMSNTSEWITENQLEQAKVQAEEIYNDFLSDPEFEEQDWIEIKIDKKYFDIEVFDDDLDNPRTKTYCCVYPVEDIPNSPYRATDGTRWVRLFEDGIAIEYHTVHDRESYNGKD